MSEKTRKTPVSQPRVPNGHGYCWNEHTSGVRCCKPGGHSGRHEYPYEPRTTW
ncbi:hypothetical protein [Streptomyces sp. SAS_272]|uniref:hypothetical protein n=1 Tax=Streptomyces sp. SAS_272 TaxID=3412747 RepID=UPI00403D1A04